MAEEFYTVAEQEAHAKRCGCNDFRGFFCKRWYPTDPDWCNTCGWTMEECQH